MDTKIDKLEMELLLEGIYKKYGYDFRNYAPASIKRRLQHNLIVNDCKSFSELLHKVLNSKQAFEKLLFDLSVTVTEMFRDPYTYKSICKYVLPVLKTYPYIKIWHAGCATGEEVYSMAILLHEHGLLDKTKLYATDINIHALNIAQEGIYSEEEIKKHNKNYIQSGGTKSLTDYFYIKYGSAKIDDKLKKNITFTYHNLAVDSSFGEMQIIICRNVLIYFNQKLQNRVLNLFDDSLSYGGFIYLGSKETLRYSSIERRYEIVDSDDKLYKKRYPAIGDDNE
jgi:chemotaxis protein methyltransferase CheR